MAFTKQEKTDLIIDAKDLSEGIKQSLKAEEISDFELVSHALRATNIAQAMLYEANKRNLFGENKGWKFDLLKEYQAAYPDFKKQQNG